MWLQATLLRTIVTKRKRSQRSVAGKLATSKSSPVSPGTDPFEKSKILTCAEVALGADSPQYVAAVVALCHAEILVRHEVMSLGRQLLQKDSPLLVTFRSFRCPRAVLV